MFKDGIKGFSGNWFSGAPVNLAGTPRLLDEIVKNIQHLRQRWISADGMDLVNRKNCHIEEAGSTEPLELAAREMAK